MMILKSLRKFEMSWGVYFLAVCCLVFIAHLRAHASEQLDAGFINDVTFPTGTGGDSMPTAEKSQSKLWFNDGFWWGSLWSSSGNEYRIHKLDLTLNDWIDTGTPIDDRKETKADTLWDGQNLYIISHIYIKNAGVSVPSGQRGQLYRYSYNSSAQIYTIDTGFPVDVTDAKSEVQVLAKDSSGRLWITYILDQQVLVNHSGIDDLDWDLDNRPFVIPTGDTKTSVGSDDISSIIAFSRSNDESNIGVLWSNGFDDTMYFAVHPDSAMPNEEWSSSVIAFNGVGDDASDDHINLKALPSGDPAGTVLAVTKTSENNSRKMLLVCRANSDCSATSDWTAHTVFIENSNISNPTRGLIQVDIDERQLYVLVAVTEPGSDRAIYYKVADLDNIQFTATDIGTPFIQGDGEKPNNITSTKQLVNGSTGLAGLAAYRRHYNHNKIDLGAGIPDITAVPASHNYGDVLIGVPETQIFEIRNDGNADLTVTATSIVDGAEFGIDSGDLGVGIALSPGQSHNLEVSFNPTVTGPRSDTLRITSDDPDESTVDVALDGNGVDTLPSVVTFEEVVTGGSTNSSAVTTSAVVTAVNDHLYLAAITSKSYHAVTSVTGLGLIWSRVDSQCGGRNATGVEVWMAQGTPTGNDTVTATQASAPSNATIAVSRYSGVDTTNPIGNIVPVNSNGVDGGCSGGTDDNAYSFNLNTTANGSVVYGAIAMRHRTHTPGLGYTERVEFVQGSSGSAASVATMDQDIAGASTVTVDGTFSSNVDYAVIGVEIKPDGSGGGTPVPDISLNTVFRDYGDVVVGASASFSFVVSNVGTADLTVSATALLDDAEFSIAGGDVGAGITLTPGQNHNLEVSFIPTDTGTRSDTLQITSDDPDESTVDVALNGNGVDTLPSMVTFEEVVTGGSTSTSAFTTSVAVTAFNDHLYLAAITSKSYRAVTSVTGLGLTWSRVDDQCGGRNATGVEVWMAQGAPTGNDTVTATLASAPKNAAIAVARYSGVNTTNPIGNSVSGNTNGEDGGCSGGTDDNAYSFNLTTTANSSVVYGAIAMRHRTHTLGLGYTERVEFVQGSGGSAASVATMDQDIASASTVTVDGTFNANVDYAVIGIEIIPQP